MSKTALILGIGGQDGSYLADVLLEQGVTVHGLYRHSSYDNLARIAHVRDRVTLHRGDLVEPESVRAAVRACAPDEIYNVADQDNVGWSRVVPDYQKAVTSVAVEELLAYVVGRPVRVFQPLSVTMFGIALPPQDEDTPLAPRSPYAQEKAKAWEYCRRYRDRGLYVGCAILFNHDSPRRAPGYLLQDVCRQAVAVARSRLEHVTVRSLDARVDVGYAREYMEAAVAMLQLPEPGDYCIGTGEAYEVWELVGCALTKAGVSPTLNHPDPAVVKNRLDYRVRVDPALVTSPQPTYRADITKARAAFGFAPGTSVGALIEMLVDHFKGIASL